MKGSKLLVVATSLAVITPCRGAGGDDNGVSEGTTETGTATQADGNDQLCSAVGDLERSVTTVQGLDESSSAADVKSAMTGVVDAGKELASAAEAGPQADVSGLQSSIQDIEDALKAVPSSDSLQAACSRSRRPLPPHDHPLSSGPERVDDLRLKRQNGAGHEVSTSGPT